MATHLYLSTQDNLVLWKHHIIPKPNLNSKTFRTFKFYQIWETETAQPELPNVTSLFSDGNNVILHHSGGKRQKGRQACWWGADVAFRPRAHSRLSRLSDHGSSGLRTHSTWCTVTHSPTFPVNFLPFHRKQEGWRNPFFLLNERAYFGIECWWWEWNYCRTSRFSNIIIKQLKNKKLDCYAIKTIQSSALKNSPAYFCTFSRP